MQEKEIISQTDLNTILTQQPNSVDTSATPKDENRRANESADSTNTNNAPASLSTTNSKPKRQQLIGAERLANSKEENCEKFFY